jgi:hypothetical protein
MEKINSLCELLARLNSLSFIHAGTINWHEKYAFYVGITKSLKLRFEQNKKGLFYEVKTRRPILI